MPSQKDSVPVHKEMMNIDSFLATYDVSRSTYYAEVKSGALRVTKLGNKPYIKRADAEKWMNEIGKY